MATLAIPEADVDIIDVLFDKVGFEPTPRQKVILDASLNEGVRFFVVAGGEQGGKSLCASKFLLQEWPFIEGPMLCWLVSKDYEGNRAEFEYMAEDFGSLGLIAPNGVSKRIDPGQIVLADGSRIESKSAADAANLRMRAPHIIIACEASTLDFGTYERMRGRVGSKKGKLFMSGTFEVGSVGWYPQMWKAWQTDTGDRRSFSLPSPENPHAWDAEEIASIKEDSSDAYFQERIMGVPVPPKGMVFARDFSPEIHVKDVEYEPGIPVHLWVDPGYAGAHAVEVVQIKKIGEFDQIQVIDEVYEQMITSDIIDIVRTKPWFKDVAHGVIDIAGTQHQAMTPPAEVWVAQPPVGIGLYMHSKKVQNVNDADERLKSFLKPHPMFGQPKIVFSPKCRGILSELGVMGNPFNGQTLVYQNNIDKDGNIVGTKPLNENNHGIKAVEYGIIWNYGYTRAEGASKVISVRRRGRRRRKVMLR
jgi:hypothetical protein|tara:strand:- start:1654 stop:3078 length:1425 start_codon:yes stop_codon:yes gene_type:complete